MQDEIDSILSREHSLFELGHEDGVMTGHALSTASVIALGLLSAGPSNAITISESLGKVFDAEYYAQYLGRASGGLKLGLSTTDNWQTAVFDITIRTNRQLGNSDVFIGFHTGVPASTLDADFSRGTSAFSFLTDGYLELSGGNNSRFKFKLTSSGGPSGVWDALVSGFGLEHFFFGGEIFNVSNVALTDRDVTNYRLDLGEAAAVPLPASAGMLAGGLVLLGALMARNARTKKAA